MCFHNNKRRSSKLMDSNQVSFQVINEKIKRVKLKDLTEMKTNDA